MRTVLLVIALGGFVALGFMDVFGGSPRTGIAALLVAVANGLFLIR